MEVQKDIKVLVVDDSPVSRQVLIHILESDARIHVIGEAKNGLEALSWLKNHQVDVVTMDIFMPGLDGFETSREIMEKHPIPIAIISGAYSDLDTQKAFKAMEAGALAILPKPAAPSRPPFEKEAQEIIKIVKTIAEVKVVTRRKYLKLNHEVPLPKGNIPKNVQAIAIGASLGGPVAIAQILTSLQKGFPVPIFIVQHISPGFTQGFVNWLKQNTALNVEVAKEGVQALPGNIYIAPDKCHMEIKPNHLIALDFTPTQGIQPSVSRLFHSMASTYGPKGLGIILTGMGKDGTSELLLMKQKGAYTIAQSEEGCLMFGMPKEAIRIGAASAVMSLNQIATTLSSWNKK